jgi:alpha-L-fucosidase
MNVLTFLFIGMVSFFNKPGMDSTKITLSLVKSGPVFENPPFTACHASTLVELDNHRIMAAWFGGSYEGSNDVCIWISIFNDTSWSSPLKVASGIMPDKSQLPCWNPVLFKSANNKLFLFYKVGKNPREWWGEVITSIDYGKSWSKPQKLPEGFLGPIKNKPIQLKSGEILCPSSTESTTGNIWQVHLEITNEQLDKWEKVTMDTSTNLGVIQPSILVHPNGALQMLCRSNSNAIVQTWSVDNGKHWDKLVKTHVPNPNSGIDAVALSDGSFLLVYNPLTKGNDWFVGRNVLSIAVSRDGIKWEDVFTLENEKEGEFSYPAVIQTSDKQIHIMYTSNRKYIKHVVLKLNH